MFLLWHPWLTTTNLSYSFPLLETSAAALCGTTGIFTYIWLILMVNVGKYSIHGSYGIRFIWIQSVDQMSLRCRESPFEKILLTNPMPMLGCCGCLSLGRETAYPVDFCTSSSTSLNINNLVKLTISSPFKKHLHFSTSPLSNDNKAQKTNDSPTKTTSGSRSSILCRFEKTQSFPFTRFGVGVYHLTLVNKQ